MAVLRRHASGSGTIMPRIQRELAVSSSTCTVRPVGRNLRLQTTGLHANSF